MLHGVIQGDHRSPCPVPQGCCHGKPCPVYPPCSTASPPGCLILSTVCPAGHDCSEMLFQHKHHLPVRYLFWQSVLSLPVSTVPMAFGRLQPLYGCSAAWCKQACGAACPPLPAPALSHCVPGHQPGSRHPPPFTLVSLKSAGLLHVTSRSRWQI